VLDENIYKVPWKCLRAPGQVLQEVWRRLAPAAACRGHGMPVRVDWRPGDGAGPAASKGLALLFQALPPGRVGGRRRCARQCSCPALPIPPPLHASESLCEQPTPCCLSRVSPGCQQLPAAVACVAVWPSCGRQRASSCPRCSCLPATLAWVWPGSLRRLKSLGS